MDGILSEMLNTNDHTIISSGRQTGKTTLGTRLVEALYAPQMRVMYIANTWHTVEAFKRELPHEIGSQISVLINSQRDSVDKLRGREFDLIVIDAYLPVSDEEINCIMQCTSRCDGRVVLLADEEQSMKADYNIYMHPDFKAVYVL